MRPNSAAAFPPNAVSPISTSSTNFTSPSPVSPPALRAPAPASATPLTVPGSAGDLRSAGGGGPAASGDVGDGLVGGQVYIVRVEDTIPGHPVRKHNVRNLT